jgi:hypothetical protein
MLWGFCKQNLKRLFLGLGEMKKRILKLGFLPVLSMILVGMVFASLSFSGELDFGGNGFDAGDDDTKDIKVTNPHVNYSLSDFNYEFDPDEFDGNPVSETDFDFGEDFKDEIDPDSTEDIDIKIEIPGGLSAIDEDFDEKRFDVGEIKITATATNVTIVGNETFIEEIIIPVSLQVANNLEFDKVQIEIDGDDPKNISFGSVQEAESGDEVKMVVVFENRFEDEDYKFGKGDVNLTLFIDDDEIEFKASSSTVEGKEKDSIEIEFDLDGYDEDEKYDVLLELFGIEGDGGLHGEEFEFEFEIKESTETTNNEVLDGDNDGISDDIDLCLTTISGCRVDEAGCMIDTDGDKICNGLDNFPNGEDIAKDDSSNVKLKANDYVKDVKDDVKVDINKDVENKPKVEEKKDNGDGFGSVVSFVFGLIVGVIGAVCFFVLTKI